MKGVRKGFSLSDEEVGFLQGRLKVLKGKKHRELRARIYAILLVGGPEMAKHDDVAHRCKVHVRTVRDWLARYREGGFEGLKDKGALVIVPSSAVDTMNLGGIAGISSLAKEKLAEDKK